MGVYAIQNNKVRAIVMDFPEAFFTLNHNLLCKIETYGFDKKVLTLIQSYFLNRHQIIIKICDHCVKSVPMRSYFWFVFSCTRTKHGDLLCKFLYSVRIQENMDQI